MKKNFQKFVLTVALLVCAGLTFSAGGYYKEFAALSTTGAGAELINYAAIPARVAKTHTFHVVVSGSPSGCTLQIEGTNIQGSTTAADYNDLSGTIPCTANTMFHIVNKPVMTLRPNILTLTGGTSPSVKLYYLGVEY